MSAKANKDLLDTAIDILAEINGELSARQQEMDPEVLALIAQKGAVTQCILREMMALMEDLSARAVAMAALLEKCKVWHDDFLVPLRDQSDGKPIAKSIYLSDLVGMIDELERVIAEGGPADVAEASDDAS